MSSMPCWRLVSTGISWYSGSLFFVTGPGTFPMRGAMAVLAFTNGNELIFVSALGSEVRMSIWFSHFDWFIIVTFGTAAMLSRYAFEMGRSVESIAMFCLVLLS